MLKIPRGSNGEMKTEVYTSGPVHPLLMKDYRAAMKAAAQPS